MEALCTDVVVALVRAGWDRAIGGAVDSLQLDCACENVVADLMENGIPESHEDAKARMEPMILGCGEVWKSYVMVHNTYHAQCSIACFF